MQDHAIHYHTISHGKISQYAMVQCWKAERQLRLWKSLTEWPPVAASLVESTACQGSHQQPLNLNNYSNSNNNKNSNNNTTYKITILKPLNVELRTLQST